MTEASGNEVETTRTDERAAPVRPATSATLDVLLARLRSENPDLAKVLIPEVEHLRTSRKFGLVFNRHLPESVKLPDHPIAPGVRVAARNPAALVARQGLTGKAASAAAEALALGEWVVTKTAGAGNARVAYLEPTSDTTETWEGPAATRDLVVVRQFGEPVYPGLRPVEDREHLPARIANGQTREDGTSDPWHLVINGENHHTLQALQFTHRGQVDLIYIDPPYNTGNKSWIYNDKYVDTVRGDTSSKWLSFMEKRLGTAFELLSDSGFIMVSIDDREQARLKVLLDQVFGPANFMATFVWRSDGNQDNQAVIKTNHEYVLMYARNIENVKVSGVKDPNLREDSKLHLPEIRNSVVKNGPKNPVSSIHLPAGFPAEVKAAKIPARQDKWPHYDADLVIKDNALAKPVEAQSGWSSAKQLRQFIDGGFKPIIDSKGQETRFVLTHTGAIEGVKVRRADQHHILTVLSGLGTVETAGNILRTMGVEFPYPKPQPLLSYLVSFAPKDGTILDFFGGSGSTAEAVIRLNATDGGTRRSILVTNNELSANEAARLTSARHAPGDPEWDQHGVFEAVTRPRLTTVVTGIRRDGERHDAPLAANIAFFNLAYLDESRVSRAKEFEAIAPLLWMQAGARGDMIATESRLDDGGTGYEISRTGGYAVLFDTDATAGLLRELAADSEDGPGDGGAEISTVFVVTDSIADYERVCSRLPATATTHMLYEAYLTNFEINTGGVA